MFQPYPPGPLTWVQRAAMIKARIQGECAQTDPQEGNHCENVRVVDVSHEVVERNSMGVL